MRLFIIRLFLGWWFIPVIWLCYFPFCYLLGGMLYAKAVASGYTRLLWWGDEPIGGNNDS